VLECCLGCINIGEEGMLTGWDVRSAGALRSGFSASNDVLGIGVGVCIDLAVDRPMVLLSLLCLRSGDGEVVLGAGGP